MATNNGQQVGEVVQIIGPVVDVEFKDYLPPIYQALRITSEGFDVADKIDVVAGGETAGIPFAAFLAALAKKPMIYVRKQPKGFGRMAQIEGDLKPGKRVLLVEDLATDGGSKLVFIDALKKADAKVTDCFVIFHYGIFPQSIETLAVAGVKLHALATWWDALEAAQKHRYFDDKGLAETRAFLEAPEQWSANHGGRPPSLRPTGLGR